MVSKMYTILINCGCLFSVFKSCQWKSEKGLENKHNKDRITGLEAPKITSKTLSIFLISKDVLFAHIFPVHGHIEKLYIFFCYQAPNLGVNQWIKV